MTTEQVKILVGNVRFHERHAKAYATVGDWKNAKKAQKMADDCASLLAVEGHEDLIR